MKQQQQQQQQHVSTSNLCIGCSTWYVRTYAITLGEYNVLTIAQFRFSFFLSRALLQSLHAEKAKVLSRTGRKYM